MANEITLNPYDEADGELSADEQESLAIGEKLAEHEQQLLAGKYRSAEDLERGYLELQKRLGDKSSEDKPQDDEQPQEDEQPEEVTNIYDQIMDSYRKGEWDQGLVQEVEGMNPVDVVNMFLSNQQQSPQATADDIEQIQGSIGGTEEYQSMIQWASQNLSEQEIAMYDAVMDRGDPLAMFFAAQALNARFQDAIGYDGQLLTGSAPRNTADVFRSQAEVVRAMSDPRYESDPAYRQDIADKLERSTLQF